MKIKGMVFSNIFEADNIKSKQIMNYHLKNGSKKRLNKIKYITNNILKLKVKNKKVFYNEKLLQFEELYKKSIYKIKLVTGINEYLKIIFRNKKRKIYIVSAAPLKEIKNICKSKKILIYINKIYDNKIDKSNALKKILFNNNNVDRKKFVFFGDSVSDYKVSLKSKIDFTSLLTNSLSNLKNKKTYIKINDFK